MTNASELSITQYMKSSNVQGNINELMKDRASQFITSVISLVNSDKKLVDVDKKSILTACMTAAALDLPINQNLGFAYIIPYKGFAQFQMGAKGFKQLAMRSGKYKTINETDVREGEYKGINRMTGEVEIVFVSDEKEREKLKVVGYLSYFKLLNGYEKMRYMTVEQLKAHAKKYSQTYKNNFGNWVDDFDSMARKTVIKLLLSKDGILSTQMQKALEIDQSVVSDEGVDYIDNKKLGSNEIARQKERERFENFINEAKTVESLIKYTEIITDFNDAELTSKLHQKIDELNVIEEGK